MRMSIELSNPKTFLALLLFIGFVFILYSIGSNNPDWMFLGGFIMLVAVVLWILSNRDKMGF